MRLAVPIKYLKLSDDAVIPQYTTPGSACMDLVATDIEYLDENKVIVRFGFSSEFSDGYKVLIMPRSSFTHKSWIMTNSPGIIDSDYRGEWMAKFEAIPIGIKNNIFIYDVFPYKIGDRIVQASIEVNIHMSFRPVNELTDSIRGSGGYGSTNKSINNE